MELRYNVSGPDRKRLVQVISEIAGVKAKYLGMPSAAYQIDFYTVDKNGTIHCDDNADPEIVERLVTALQERGFEHSGFEYDNPQPEPDCTEPIEDCPPAYGTPETVGLTVQVPLEKVQVENLNRLLEAKGKLIRNALRITETPVEVQENKVSFPWFTTALSPEEVTAYSHFIAALCEMSKNQKRITAQEKDVDNEKYAFRCFLLRLGFIGAEFKAERKILLRNLTGSSAFKSGSKKEVASNEVSE